ncbi:MAG: hypothetical protein JO328_14990, partial [Hyphomicrobiales bacterium]|nr:hypothetical protein [Hyphomicrobiales bacterium]
MTSIAEPRILVDVAERGRGARVATVTINNARKLNTFNSALMDDFVAAFAGLAG